MEKIPDVETGRDRESWNLRKFVSECYDGQLYILKKKILHVYENLFF